jgi:flavin-dependent dehydrogenase
MSNRPYDAIVVGARCAGSPTALLLARKGYDVLVVDRARFPSDTISTHLIHPPGVAALRRWGLLDRLVATGCPAIDTYVFTMGPLIIAGRPGTDDSPVAYGPRRTVLDKMLIDAAAEAGAGIREGFVVDDLIVEDGRVRGVRGHDASGQAATERAQVVVGADGWHSLVAQKVGAAAYDGKDPLVAGYYSYWSGLPMDGRFEAFDLGDRALAAWPTNDGLTLVIAGWRMGEFDNNKKDIERHYLETIDRAPAFAERVRAARREERFYGAFVPNFFRPPFGPGWALVGDAGYTRDFMTAQGISDAFRDAELCAEAIDSVLRGAKSADAAAAGYQGGRDRQVRPMYEFTLQFAALAPPPPEMQALMQAIAADQDAMDGFARVISGVTSPADFFSEQNVGRIFARSASS